MSQLMRSGQALSTSPTPHSQRLLEPPQLTAPTSQARFSHRREDLDGNPVSVTRDNEDVHPLPRLVDVTPQHLQPPVNFPPSLLLTYERQGFPSDTLRNYYAGTYVAPAALTRTPRGPRDLPVAPFNMSLWSPYSGPVLRSVEPLALVQFMVDWKAFQCTGT
jgi:hypothetical protein